MIKDCFPAYLAIAIWFALALVLLTGCAADPDPPIARYRAAYGFTP